MSVNNYYIFLVGAVIVAAFSQVLLKKSAGKVYPSILREYLNVYVISGYALMILSTLLTIVAYKKVDFKNGPVVESLGFIFVMILSWLFFQEKITRRKLLGNAMILIGILVFYS